MRFDCKADISTVTDFLGGGGEKHSVVLVDFEFF